LNMQSLPQGWIWSTLGEVADYGKTIKVEPSEIKPGEWVLELEDIEKGSSKLIQRADNLETQSKSTKNRFKKGDVLYGKLRPYLNKVLLADIEGVCSTEIIPVSPL
jgi:type I restriction enzyme, S subunit